MGGERGLLGPRYLCATQEHLDPGLRLAGVPGQAWLLPACHAAPPHPGQIQAHRQFPQGHVVQADRSAVMLQPYLAALSKREFESMCLMFFFSPRGQTGRPACSTVSVEVRFLRSPLLQDLQRPVSGILQLHPTVSPCSDTEVPYLISVRSSSTSKG